MTDTDDDDNNDGVSAVVIEADEPANHVLQFMAEATLTTALMDVDGITLNGLHLLRMRLRLQDTAERVEAMGANAAEVRRLLLDRVTRAIANGNPDILALYGDLGGLVTGVPDDLSELDDHAEANTLAEIADLAELDDDPSS